MAAPKLDHMNPLLDKRLINAFIEGVIKTLSTMAQTDVTPGKATVEPQFTPKGEVAGVVGMVAGDIKANMTISFPKEGIFLVLENMLGEKYTDINNEVADAIGELTNMIYGSAKTTLNQMGYAFQMALPSVIKGEVMISKQHAGATLVIPFNLPNHTVFHIEITVQQ